MKAQTVHMNDKMLRDAVIAQLDFEPEVNPAGIGVAAEDGVVTLSGFVDDYAQKVAAERAVKRLFGVKGLANELMVRMVYERTDTDIAKDAIHILESDVHFPSGKVTVTVEDGLLTLEGTVEWNFQREAAERAVQRIRGVKAVANMIEISLAASPSDIQRKIGEALRRSAEVDARQIKVTARDHLVVLSGNVRSWSEREEAERAAWSAAGVVRVENLLVVEPRGTGRLGSTKMERSFYGREHEGAHCV
jgi:osmotically-inducible protein OsmY